MQAMRFSGRGHYEIFLAAVVGLVVAGASSCKGGSGGETANPSPATGGAAGAGGFAGAGIAGRGGAGAAPVCTGPYCESLAKACAHGLPLCVEFKALYESNPEGAVAYCVHGIQLAVDKYSQSTGADPAKATKDYAACLLASKYCYDTRQCDPNLPKSMHCSGDECDDEPIDTTPMDGGVVLDAAKPDVFAPAPGDNVNCVICAEKQCPAEGKLCFWDAYGLPGCAPNSKGIRDCCVEYRTCIAGCVNDDPLEEAKCVLGLCQPSLPSGSAQFDTYATCMNAKCANCGSTP